MIPYVVLYTYFTNILRYFTVGRPHAISRILLDDLYIAYDPPNAILVSDINVPVGVLPDSYGYIGTTRKITSSSTREVM